MNSQSESMNAVKEIIDNEEQLKECVRRAETQISQLVAEAKDMAYLLASAGHLPHKEKNEVILQVISKLLVIEPVHMRDMEDIPF